MGRFNAASKRKTAFRVDTVVYSDAELDWRYVDCPWDFISDSHAEAVEKLSEMQQVTAHGALELAREQFPEFVPDGIEFNLNEVDDFGVTTLETRDFPIEVLEG